MNLHTCKMRRVLATRSRLFLLAAALLAPALFFLARQTIWACAVAPRPGDYVGIANETALIIWDADSKTQHFIRRATFDTKAKDFGFLVPTPTRPELDEAHDYLFRLLEKATAPAERTVLAVVQRGAPGEATDKARGNSVQIIETKRVGDFDAVVLKADDPKALDQWLGKHGYAADAALTDWLAPYVEKGWFLTAFKIVKNAGQQAPAAASAVRMSFRTEKPFFPYREPATQADAKQRESGRRLLRLYVLANARMEGNLGEAGAAWPGTTVWSGAMPKDEDQFLLYTLKVHDKVKGKQWRLTEFEDWSSPRPGTDDVYFSASADPSPVARPPITRYLYHEVESAGPFSPLGSFVLGVVSATVLLTLACVVVMGLRRQKMAG